MYEILTFIYSYRSRTNLFKQRIGLASGLKTAIEIIENYTTESVERIHHFEIQKYPVDVKSSKFIQSGIWILDEKATVIFKYPDFAKPFTGLKESEVAFQEKEIVEVLIEKHESSISILVPAIVLSIPPLITDAIFKKSKLIPFDETDCKYDVLLFEKGLRPSEVSFQKHSHIHIQAWKIFKCNRNLPSIVENKLEVAYNTLMNN